MTCTSEARQQKKAFSRSLSLSCLLVYLLVCSLSLSFPLQTTMMRTLAVLYANLVSSHEYIQTHGILSKGSTTDLGARARRQPRIR